MSFADQFSTVTCNTDGHKEVRETIAVQANLSTDSVAAGNLIPADSLTLPRHGFSIDSTGAVVVGRTGRYLVSYTISPANTPLIVTFGIFVNGIDVDPQVQSAPGAFNDTVLLHLRAGDVVAIGPISAPLSIMVSTKPHLVFTLVDI